MSIAYNDLFRQAQARLALKAPAIPARTLGVTPWNREAPLHPLYRPEPKQRVDVNQILAAGRSSGSYEGVPGRGRIVPNTPELATDPWYGPGVM